MPAKNQWIYQGRWQQPVISGCLWANWYYNKKINLKIKGSMLILDGHCFELKSDIGLLKKFLKSNINNYDFLDNIDSWFLAAHRQAIEMNRKSLDHINSLQNLKLIFKLILPPWELCHILDQLLLNFLYQECVKDNIDINKLLVLIKPIRPTITIDEKNQADKIYKKIDSLKLSSLSAQSIKNKSAFIYNTIKNHVNKYKFLGVHHFIGQPYTIVDFLKNYSNKKTAVNSKPINKNTKLPTNYNWFIKLGSILSWGRLCLAETAAIIEFNYRKKLQQINKSLNLKPDQYLWLSLDELISAIKNKKPISNKEILARRQCYGVIPQKNRIKIITGKKVDSLLKKLLNQQPKRKTILTGIPVSPGKVIAPACLMSELNDVKKFKPNQIIIAPELPLEFLNIIKQSSGVVTEFGGLTSHIFTLAREFNLPSLVKVAHATKIIKDGDLVELDADKGVVRKIK